MYVDLVNNLAVTSAFLFIAGRIFRNQPLEFTAPIKIRVYIGLGFGLLGFLLMLSTIKVTDDIIVDQRQLAIVIAAILGGPVSAILAGTMVGIMRLVLFGISTTSVIVAIVTLSMSILLGYYSRMSIPRIYKYILMNFSYIAASSILIYVLVNDSSTSYRTLGHYWIVCCIAGVFTYYVIEYVQASNQDHRSIQYFKLMAENSSDLISTHDLDGRFKYVSSSSFYLLGYKPEELMGQNPFEFYHSEDLLDIRKSHSDVINSYKDSLIRYRFKHKEGRYIWLETASKRIVTSESDELICASRDITARIQTEKELLQANDKLQQISQLDGLTDIPNRRGFDQRIDDQWQKALQDSSPLSLIMFDVDYFKRYNDTYGHHLGDECLKKIAKTAQSTLNRPNDYIARYGGEEFAVILPETSKEEALMIAESIREAVRALNIPHSNSKIIPIVTISAGVATIVPSLQSPYLQLIIVADEALYRAKQEGRNRVLCNS